MTGHVLPVTEDPDEYHKIRQHMIQFPHLYTALEKLAYGIKDDDSYKPKDYRSGSAF